MPRFRVFNLGGVNTRISPFNQQDGQLIHCVNMYTDSVGAKRKRSGYTTFLGTPDSSQVNTLFQYSKEDGTTSFLYRASGSALYHWDAGVGTATDWTLSANGTIADGGHVGHEVLNDTLILGDGVGSTRHTTDGTSFTDTVLAPVGEHFSELFRRIYIGGTSSTEFYSVTNDPTNWDTSGTSDSSSFTVPGEGAINSNMVSYDRIVIGKDSGKLLRWDDYELVTIPTKQAPSSPYSIVDIEGYKIYLNRWGFFGYGGDRPEILSNSIQNQIYNNEETGIAGTAFDNAPAGINRFQYFCTMGSVRDSFTQIPIDNAVAVYDYQLDEWVNYQFADKPTSYTTYQDNSGVEHLLFGDDSGQVYKYSGTATSDNGASIEASLVGFLHLGSPDVEKIFKDVWSYANPGCQASLQVAASETFTLKNLDWVDVGSLQSGVNKFSYGGRGRFLFYRLHEKSTASPLIFYGLAVDAEVIGED